MEGLSTVGHKRQKLVENLNSLFTAAIEIRYKLLPYACACPQLVGGGIHYNTCS